MGKTHKILSGTSNGTSHRKYKRSLRTEKRRNLQNISNKLTKDHYEDEFDYLGLLYNNHVDYDLHDKVLTPYARRKLASKNIEPINYYLIRL